ncbi:hypothetical protein L227DRAFT_394720 [Lentinus tigrinus ALCF2SS1-6]|uniref:Uncharacterized protein n=1 Tax=Lentinus tigrinus ALCF2SS1-6 TaxID=1328759 RepID=A0A5C2SIH3_9APHY|nr:hypothetical protein L227DRAFT_394720 [Lentinus tigrinus ALCF2SS1-6]
MGVCRWSSQLSQLGAPSGRRRSVAVEDAHGCACSKRWSPMRTLLSSRRRGLVASRLVVFSWGRNFDVCLGVGCRLSDVSSLGQRAMGHGVLVSVAVCHIGHYSVQTVRGDWNVRRSVSGGASSTY